METEKKPWDRQKGESSKAYPAFVIYLQMENRSIQKVADLLSKNRQQLDKWANEFNWRERAAAYDSSIVEATRQDKISKLKEFNERKIRLASLMLDKSEEILNTISIKRGSFRAAVELGTAGNQMMTEALTDNQDEVKAPYEIVIKRAERNNGEGS